MKNQFLATIAVLCVLISGSALLFTYDLPHARQAEPPSPVAQALADSLDHQGNLWQYAPDNPSDDNLYLTQRAPDGTLTAILCDRGCESGVMPIVDGKQLTDLSEASQRAIVDAAGRWRAAHARVIGHTPGHVWSVSSTNQSGGFTGVVSGDVVQNKP